jgi:hypothetical protein
MTGAAFASGRIAMFADVPKDQRHVFAVLDGKLSFILSFETNDYFWQVADNGKQFHALSPLEGVVTAAFFLVLYWLIIRRLGRVGVDSIEGSAAGGGQLVEAEGTKNA